MVDKRRPPKHRQNIGRATKLRSKPTPRTAILEACHANENNRNGPVICYKMINGIKVKIST